MGYSSLSAEQLIKVDPRNPYPKARAAFMRLPKPPPLPPEARFRPGRQGRWSVKLYTDDFEYIKEVRLKAGRSGDDQLLQERIMGRAAQGYGATIFRWHLNGRISHVTEY